MRDKLSKQATSPEPPAAATFHLINTMEYEVRVLQDGVRAIAILSEVLRDAEKPSYSDLEDAVVWVAHRLEEVGNKLHDKWDAANSFAFDVAHPEFATQRKARGEDNEA